MCGVNYVQFAFEEDTKVQAAGDIRTLVDWANPTEVETSNARFARLFMDCVELVTSPELPATTLAKNCYSEMFSGCTSLTQAPELPATTLASECYQYMFFGCEKLSSVTMLATDVSASDALCDWLDGTKEGGTLYVASGMETDEEITGSLPTGKNWKVAVAATN